MITAFQRSAFQNSAFQIEAVSADVPITNAGQFFGLPGPPEVVRKVKERIEVAEPVLEPVAVAKVAARVLEREAFKDLAAAWRATALAHKARASEAVAARRAAEVQALDRIISAEIAAYLAEIDDEECLLLAA